MTEFRPLCPQRHRHATYTTKKMRLRGYHLAPCECGLLVAVKPNAKEN